MRPISDEIRDEAIRLRIERQLSTPTIARQLGVSNATIYKALRGHPWRPSRKNRRIGRGLAWTDEDVAYLRGAYSASPRAVIRSHLANRQWHTICKMASMLGLHRDPRATYLNHRHVPAICEQLRRERERQKMTRPQLSEKIGYHHNQILAWELGKAQPRLSYLADWAAGLGFDLALRPKLDVVSDQSSIAPPSRQQLMAGRA
jgi:transcriptional regulator with XRE-family HTH domain